MKLLIFIFYLWHPPGIPHKILTWDDFTTVNSFMDNTVAESVTSIGYDYNGAEDVKVKCTFHSKESFVLKSAKTAYILSHEQAHLDITYIYAVKFANDLKNVTELSESKIECIYNIIIAEKDKMQRLYDEETNNSENKSMQTIWGNKIKNILNQLKWE